MQISELAGQAYESFVRVYWDPEAHYFYSYSDHLTHEHAVGPEKGKYAHYWWEAQIWETVMDVFEATHDGRHLTTIDQIFDGFIAAYPDFRWNDWNDDIGWWARGCVRAYELTKKDLYLTSARTMFDHIYQFCDDVYGGGIWWKSVDVGNGSKNEKNVATNATAVYTAMRIYAATKDASYRNKAERIFLWLRDGFYREGHLLDHVNGDGAGTYVAWDWTYNNGTYAGACLEMYLDTRRREYLAEAITAIEWAVKNMTRAGTFVFEGEGDAGGFKAILTRNMNAVLKKAGHAEYEALLANNASRAGAQLNSDTIGGYDWMVPAPDLSAKAIQSLAAAATVAILHQAPQHWPLTASEGTRV